VANNPEHVTAKKETKRKKRKSATKINTKNPTKRIKLMEKKDTTTQQEQHTKQEQHAMQKQHNDKRNHEINETTQRKKQKTRSTNNNKKITQRYNC